MVFLFNKLLIYVSTKHNFVLKLEISCKKQKEYVFSGPIDGIVVDEIVHMAMFLHL